MLVIESSELTSIIILLVSAWSFMSSKCINCGSKRLSQIPYVGILADSAIEKELFSELKVIVCLDCGLGYPSSKLDPKMLDSYYEYEYASLRQFVGLMNGSWIKTLFLKLMTYVNALIGLIIGYLDPRNEEISSNRFASQVAFIKPHLNPNNELRLLEFGAGDAEFSRVLKESLNVDVQVDIVEPAPQYDKSFKDLGFFKIGVDSSCLNDGQYDLVHVSHVLQHLPSLDHDLEKLSLSLKPGGLIFLEVPNACREYWNARVFPNPPFLNFFSIVSIRGLANKYKLSVVKETTFGESIRLSHCSSFKLKGKFHPEFTREMFLQWRLKEIFLRILASLRPSSILRGERLMSYKSDNRAFIRVIYRKL